MFDEYLRRRTEETGQPFVPFDIHADYTPYVDGRKRADGVRSFLASRGISLPEGTATDPPAVDTVSGLGNRKNELVLARMAAGVEVYPGSVRYVEAVRDAGLRRAVVSSSANTRAVLKVTRLEDLFEEVVDGLTAEREGLAGKPAPGMFHLRRPVPAASPPPRRRCSRTRWPAWRPGGRGDSGSSSGSTAPGRRKRCKATAPTSWSPTWPTSSPRGRGLGGVPRKDRRRDRRVGLQDRAVAGPGGVPRPRRAGPERVGLRPRQRAPRTAGQPRRGRALRPARHLPERRLRAAARCPTPRPATATPSRARR